MSIKRGRIYYNAASTGLILYANYSKTANVKNTYLLHDKIISIFVDFGETKRQMVLNLSVKDSK